MKIWLTIAECMGTDNEFTTDVYAMTSAQEAGNHASALIADMMVAMSIDEDIDVTSNWELEGDGWFYRVRIEEHEIGDVALEPKNNLKTFAVDIEWDTDDECYDDDEDDDEEGRDAEASVDEVVGHACSDGTSGVLHIVSERILCISSDGFGIRFGIYFL